MVKFYDTATLLRYQFTNMMLKMDKQGSVLRIISQLGRGADAITHFTTRPLKRHSMNLVIYKMLPPIPFWKQ